MNRNNRNQLIQSYLNLIEQNNHQINQNTQLMHSHEQTLNRLIFENQVPQNYRNVPTPIFFNRQSSQRPMTSTSYSWRIWVSASLRPLKQHPRPQQRSSPTNLLMWYS